MGLMYIDNLPLELEEEVSITSERLGDDDLAGFEGHCVEGFHLWK